MEWPVTCRCHGRSFRSWTGIYQHATLVGDPVAYECPGGGGLWIDRMDDVDPYDYHSPVFGVWETDHHYDVEDNDIRVQGVGE